MNEHNKMILLLASLALLCSCAPGGNEKDGSAKVEIEALKARVGQLESENQELKKRLSSEGNGKDLGAEGLGKQASGNEGADPGSGSGIGTGDGDTGAKMAKANYKDLDDVFQKEMILDLAQLGVFDPAETEFKPEDKITRAGYARLLFQTYNKLMPEEKKMRLAPAEAPFFKDLSADHADYKYVQALANAGFSVGYEDKTFKPEQAITREEMIGMKVGVDCGKTFDPYRGQMAFVWKFSDSKDITERFTGYIHQDFYVGGPKGSNIQRAFGKLGTFHPKYPVTRAEAAGTLWQMGQFGNYTAAAALKKLAGS